MKKNLFWLFLSLVPALSLPAMINETDQAEKSFKHLIEEIDAGALENNACFIITELTTIALHNPGNMLARAYLWALLKKPREFFSEEAAMKPCSMVKGKALAKAMDFDHAPENMRTFIWDNFLLPSSLAAEINRNLKSYRAFKISKPNKTKLLNAKNVLQGHAKSLIELCSSPGSLHAFDILKNHYPIELCPLNELINTVKKANLETTIMLNESGLASNYFGKSGELFDGSIEFKLAKAGGSRIEELMLGNLAAALGHETALRELLYTGIARSEKDPSLDREWLRLYALYVARIVGDPASILIAAVENLNSLTHQEQGIELFEYFLAMPEATSHSLGAFLDSNLNKEGLKKYSPHALTLYYLGTQNQTRALENYLLAWKKGFVPNSKIRTQILNSFDQENALKNVDTETLLEKTLEAQLPASHQLSNFLMSIYLKLDRDDNAQSNFIECIKLLEKQKDAVGIENLYAQQSLVLSLKYFIFNESLWPNERSSLVEIKEIFQNLENLMPKGDMASYYFVRYLSSAKLGNKEEARIYLKKAAENGNEYATVLYYSHEIFKMMVKSVISSVKTAPENIQQSENLAVYDHKKVGNKAIERGTKESKNIVLASHNINKNTVRSTVEAKANIKNFIKKWRSIHWKNSARRELLNDFKIFVLHNAEIKSQNSTFLHSNHGRRKDKYGTRASSFEIDTLIKRAEKFLKMLEK